MYTSEVLHRLIRYDGQEELLDQSSQVSFAMCMHKERGKLLSWTMGWIHSAVSLYEKLGGDSQDLFSSSNLPPRVLEHIQDQTFHGIEECYKTNCSIVRAMLICTPCAQRRHRLAEKYGIKDDSGLVITRPQKQKEEHHGAGRKDGEGEEEERNRESEDLSEGEGESEINYRRELLEMARRMGGKLVTGRKEATRRSKPIQPYRFKEERPTAVVKSFDQEFDSYHTGPTVEMLVESHRELCLAFQFSPTTARWNTVGDRFSDHGYRRTAGGFHQFYLNEPSQEEQLAHLFPLPSKVVLEEWKKTKTPVDQAEDMEEWTLGQMVGPQAGEQGREGGMTTYIKGRTESQKYIHLNLHKSRKVVESIDFSTDIDSVLWVTDKLKVLGSLTIHLLPYRGESAPIRKHNHAYVELYWPRTMEEEGRGERSHASQEVPISNLPNTHFAHFGKTEGSPEVFVVFPRMKHKYPLRKMWETKIPSEVETFWLDNLVYPALRSLGSGVRPYTDWTVEDIEYKHRGSKEKGLTVSSKHLTLILKKIGEILEENEAEESYTRFGSFFFVLQILGIKVSTSLDNQWERLWEKLLGEHSFLDWAYMENPENGELLVDLGFGFHPPEGSNVVGFWDVEALRVGFDYGGYGTGTTHGVSTASAIGGIHAEMTTRRRKRTHIAYRLTYNLPYEVLRGQKTRKKESFFPFVSAYTQDKKYTQGVEGVIQAFDRCMNKSYGVRDEYRCRASSIKRLLPHLRKKVRGCEGKLLVRQVLNYSFLFRQKNTSDSWTPLSGSLVQSGLPLLNGESRRSAVSRIGSTGSRPLWRIMVFSPPSSPT
jgi:hypothetical protein